MTASPPIPHKVPVIRRQIPPRAARPGTEQDPVDRPPVICPPATPARVRRHQRRQPLPLLILKIMPGNHINMIYTPGPSRSRKHALERFARCAFIEADDETHTTDDIHAELADLCSK